MATNGLREGKDGLWNGGGPQWFTGNKLGSILNGSEVCRSSDWITALARASVSLNQLQLKHQGENYMCSFCVYSHFQVAVQDSQVLKTA